MGSEKQFNAEEEEGEIPVLTVLKNNTILKNIFIVNKPPEEQARADHVDVLLVGRHPDCDLMLTHPSISRFHLQIRSKPSSRTFSLLDLSSVHGTWVSGRRIEPMVSVEMKEGETLRIGVSSRLYRLHWIPISRAYDLENPFVAQLDSVAEEEEEEEEEEEKMLNLNCCPAEMEEIESVDSVLEDLSSLFLNENVELTVTEEIPLEPWMLEDMVSLCCEEERKSPSKEEAIGIPSDPFGTETSYLPMISDDENNLCDSVSQVLSPPYVESLVQCDDTLTENLSETSCLPAVEAVLETKMLQFHTPPDTFTSPLSSGHENSFEKHYFSLPVNTAPSSLDEESAPEAVIVPKETECESEDDESIIDIFTVPESLHAAEDVITPNESESECTLRDDGSVTDAFIAGSGIFNSEDMFLAVEEVMPGTKVEQIKIVEKDMYRSLSQLLNDKFCQDQGHSLNEMVQDVRNKHTDSTSPTLHQIESVNLSVPEVVLNIMNEDQTLHSEMEILESCVKAVEKTSTNIWSRRGKATIAPQVRTSKSILKNAANVEVAMSSEKDIRNRTISKNLSSVLDGEIEEEEDEEIYTPDKENISPNTLHLQFLKKVKIEEIEHSKSQRSRRISGDTFNCDIHPNESINPTLCNMNKKDLFSVLDGGEGKEKEIFIPEEENFSPNALQLWLLKKKGKVEEIKRSKSQRSPLSKGTFNHDMYPNENIGSTLCNMNQKDSINRTISRDLFSDLDGEEEEEEIFTPDKENFSPNTLQLRLLKKKGKVEEIKHSKSQRSPLSKGTFNPDMYKNESIGPSLCKINQKDIINKTLSKDLLSNLDGEEEEEEIFTPDKENFSPNTLRLRLLKKKDNFCPNLYPDENMSHTSTKENQTLKGVQGQKLKRKPFSSHIKFAQEQDYKDRVERVPFQSLKISGDKRRSGTFCPVSASKSLHFSNCGQILDQRINPSDISGVPKKSSWDMIVDTTSLVNKESRKAMQLLQGLKGTRLIIPRLVIGELERMKKQFTIFRRISEASLALEWIEECMVKSNRWIHIQSSVDEGRLIAPTPPASPQAQFSEESWTSLSPQKFSTEIASPTVEDHILDFALLYRRNKNDGQLVLLSEDVTLKIKCMAEGLLCEPVQEFRESLVNPFSERFLWDNSVPRGQTWSCQDDVVLREKYCRLRKPSKGVASGLKLILLHNSQYGL
ncbi:hypothetical protein AAZX31_02G070700 [Glycine max]|nr:hypothetical protein JHK85_003612 [Glycine max]KAH1260549.1 FHA domain-containing protein PS1 [Glycine max]